MAKRFSRYDDDTKGSFTSVVRDGKGNPVTSGSGKAVMSRSFRAPAAAPAAPSKPKTTRPTPKSSTGGPARYGNTAAPRAQQGGRVRHKAQASSTGGPSRYQAPAMQTGPRTRPNNAPTATATAKSATATTKATKRVPGRAIALALRNAFTGKGPTDPAKILQQSRNGIDPVGSVKPKPSGKKPSRRDGRKPAGR